jgi:hypothetical protein
MYLDEGVKYKADAVITISIPQANILKSSHSKLVSTVDLKNKFIEEYRREGDCLYGFGDAKCTGHWNEEGHQLAAGIMSEEIILQTH